MLRQEEGVLFSAGDLVAHLECAHATTLALQDLEAPLAGGKDGRALALIPAGLGFFSMLVSPKRQGWHDRFAHTVVIYDESSAPWSRKSRCPSWSGRKPKPRRGR